MKVFKKFFGINKHILYYFFSKLIFFSIFYLNRKKINLFYTDRAGYGDFIFFCLELKKQLNNHNKIFCYTKIQYEIARFFYEEKYIAKNIFLLPSFIINTNYISNQFLIKSKYFRPTHLTRPAPDNEDINLPISEWWNGNNLSIKYIASRIEKFEISKQIKKICEKKTLCIFVKNFSNFKNNHLNFQVRQTRDLNKIYKLINFLSDKNLNIVILGKKNDNFVKTFPNFILETKKNVFLFNDLSKDHSISDQAYLAQNSIGYLGNMSGPTSFYGILNKEGIIIDAASFYTDHYFKNFLFLYKKIYDKKNKNLKNFVWQQYYEPDNFEIVENTYEEIINNLETKILKKQNI